jgi:hypothetical protein
MIIRLVVSKMNKILLLKTTATLQLAHPVQNIANVIDGNSMRIG